MNMENAKLWFKTNKVKTVSSKVQMEKNMAYETALSIFDLVKRMPQIINEEQNSYEKGKTPDYINGYKQAIKDVVKRIEKEVDKII